MTCIYNHMRNQTRDYKLHDYDMNQTGENK